MSARSRDVGAPRAARFAHKYQFVSTKSHQSFAGCAAPRGARRDSLAYMGCAASTAVAAVCTGDGLQLSPGGEALGEITLTVPAAPVVDGLVKLHHDVRHSISLSASLLLCLPGVRMMLSPRAPCSMALAQVHGVLIKRRTVVNGRPSARPWEVTLPPGA